MRPSDAANRLPLTRRKLLSVGAGTVTALAGLGALSGSAAAWDRLDAHFRGCSEVWITVGENDLDCQDEHGTDYKNCPLEVAVIIAHGRDVYFETVKIKEEKATKIPGKFGDEPVFKHSVSGGKKIIGIVGLAPGEPRPVDADLVVNHNRCANTPNTPDPYPGPWPEDHWV